MTQLKLGIKEINKKNREIALIEFRQLLYDDKNG